MATNTEKGKEGEDMAAEFLVNIGYEILDRNFRANRGEIDIIARHGNELVFVEVKTQLTTDFGSPEEYVTNKKQTLIAGAAEVWLTQRQWDEHPSRFDVVAINRATKPPEITHYVDAFIPGWNV
jgi:putative endonuclease